MKALDILKQKLKEQNPNLIPGTERVTLSSEQISSFFDRTVIPAFEKIVDELKGFPVRTFIRKYAAKSRILINDDTSSFSFKIEINNKTGALQVSFNYSDDIITSRYRPGKSTGDAGVAYACETINLNEYENVTEDHIIEKFTDCYFDREVIARQLVEERKVSSALFEERESVDGN